ncbi:MAG: hypothetical protein DDT22_01144 [candidate division WS2 bacterium]|nr:hypothetical protein [Candidatus Lithacetigena glycinireducens]MBT9175465.1 hypothetical protein [Candidatus Lithacetigena glycinireducens]
MIRLLLAYFLFSLKKFIVYRINLLGQVISIIIPIAINCFLWNSIISHNEISYSLPQMMIYIIIANFIFSFTHISASEDLEECIRSHKLGQRLVRPVHFAHDILLQHLMYSLLKLLLVYGPLAGSVMLILGGQIDPSRVPLFLLTLFMAFSLNASLSFLIGFGSFWMTEIWGVAAIRNTLTGLLAGTMFPISIFPAEVQSLFLHLPFPYMAYMPTKVLSDHHFDLAAVKYGLLVSAFWLVVLLSISVYMYKLGITRYTVKGA